MDTGLSRNRKLPPISGAQSDYNPDIARTTGQGKTDYTNYHQDLKSEDLLTKGDSKPEVHFIGQILGGENFDSNDGLFCEMLLQIGDTWSLLSPKKLYQTQTCYADIDEIFVWSHPVDIHLAAGDLSGWYLSL